MGYICLCLILLNNSWRIYSIPKESKYTAVFLSINNKTQCVPLLCLLLRFMTYVPFFILGKLSIEKTPLNLCSQLKYLVISILVIGWSRTKHFYPYILLWPPPYRRSANSSANNGRIPPSCLFPALLTPFLVIAFIIEEVTGCINEEAIGTIITGRNPPSCFLFRVLLFH